MSTVLWPRRHDSLHFSLPRNVTWLFCWALETRCTWLHRFLGHLSQWPHDLSSFLAPQQHTSIGIHQIIYNHAFILRWPFMHFLSFLSYSTTTKLSQLNPIWRSRTGTLRWSFRLSQHQRSEFSTKVLWAGFIDDCRRSSEGYRMSLADSVSVNDNIITQSYHSASHYSWQKRRMRKLIRSRFYTHWRKAAPTPQSY